MKIIYAGAPEFSIAPLNSIINAGFNVVAVITQPDKPVGRKGVITPTPLKVFAEQKGIKVFTFEKIRQSVGEIIEIGADLMITCAYGQLLTQEVLNAFPLGVFNIHASLLPKYRGAAPIAASVIHGESQTGVTVMKTDIGLDTGEMLLKRSVEISKDDTAGTLSEKLSSLGASAIVDALNLIKSGNAVYEKQENSLATLVKKIKKEHALCDFSTSSEQLSCFIRGMNPAPVAYSYLNGKAVNFFFAKVADFDCEGQIGEVVRADKTGVYVKTGNGVLNIVEMQLEGGKRMRAVDLVNGRKISVGMRFEREKV